MSKILLVALSFTLLAVAKGDHPVSWYRDFEDFPLPDVPVARNAERAYRLPKTVVPLEYDIYIDLYFDEATDKKDYSFDGRESILIKATEADVKEIVLHANVDKVESVTIAEHVGTTGPGTAKSVQFETEELYHFLKIKLDEALKLDVNYTLNIEYTNTMNEGPMKRGIWRGYYTDANGQERIYATTHFQPYNARQAFPCWDEPLFKAVFKLHLTRPAAYVGTFSNTIIVSNTTLANGRVRSDFAPTPVMSSYLVTFLVSETFQVLAEDTSFKPAIRIIGRSNTVGLADHALDLAVKMTEFFNNYFEIPYETLHPYLLNDHISSPDWASAGTENWGMVSYRELYMIINKSETIMSNEHYAATLVSHELAHKWFGNLITCYWWSNTWINEGYASYFGYIATNVMFPEYEFPDHFNSRYLQNSLSFDSGSGTVPLNHEVNTPLQVTGHFGTISYSKAAAFLRQTANIISPDTFQKSCKYFLMANAYNATDQYDLQDAMLKAIEEDGSLADYPNFSFTEYYRIWVNEPGYPILQVNVNHATGVITLTQERFFISGTANSAGTVYPIPITYSSKSNRNFDNLKPEKMMSLPSDTITKNAAEEWVIFNNKQHGHYRVNYDEKTWGLIAEALLNEPDTIHYLNRAQVVDDVFALMRSQRMTLNFGFDILRFLANETNFHVWEPAISGYTWYRNRLRHIPDKQAQFDTYILGLMEHAITTLGFEPAANETPTVTMARQNILHFACMLGHVRCNQESWDRFVNLRDNGVPINSRVRRNVYVTAMREGDENDFDFLLKRFRESNYANDQLEMLRGLGASRDPKLLTRYLELTLTKEVRSHDKLNSFNYALLGNRENAYTVLQFVKENMDAIRTAYVHDAPPRPVQSALTNLASYLDEPGLVEYDHWLRTAHPYPLAPEFVAAINAITAARSNMAWGTANVDSILAAAKASAAVPMTSLAMLVAMSVLLFVV
uniref:Aminopeptidase n=1 Tax=Helicoverpa armigera TaxID=29058 RepID=B8PYI5_HELAM|nr:aminopeptidase N-6 [Helicoverpa armigera]